MYVCIWKKGKSIINITTYIHTYIYTLLYTYTYKKNNIWDAQNSIAHKINKVRKFYYIHTIYSCFIHDITRQENVQAKSRSMSLIHTHMCMSAAKAKQAKNASNIIRQVFVYLLLVHTHTHVCVYIHFKVLYMYNNHHQGKVLHPLPQLYI